MLLPGSMFTQLPVTKTQHSRSSNGSWTLDPGKCLLETLYNSFYPQLRLFEDGMARIILGMLEICIHRLIDVRCLDI